MKKLKYSDFVSQMNNNKFSATYLFVGKEEYLKEQALQQLTKKFINDQTKYFDSELFYADETSADMVVNAVCTLPILSLKKLVVVKNLDEWNKNDKSIILDYLNNPAETGCLVLIAEELDSKDSLYKKIDTINGVINFWPFFENEMKKWISDKFKQDNKTISQQAMESLYENGGELLSNLDKEIEKIILYIKGRKEVTIEDIELLTGNTRIETINRLLKSICDNDVEKSLSILDELFDEGEEPLKILNWLTRRIKQLLIAQHLKNKGFDEETIASQVGIYDWVSKRSLFSQLRNFTQDKLIAVFNHCLYTDWDLKTSKKSPKIVLENLLLNIFISETNNALLNRTAMYRN